MSEQDQKRIARAVAEWKPQYRTERKRVRQWLCDGLDANYDYTSAEGPSLPKERVEQIVLWLRTMAEDPTAYLASDYGGWPRIWKPVLAVGMADNWPYWRPRPTVMLDGALGPEWQDWTGLTGCERWERKQ